MYFLQALARLRFSATVAQSDVDEALRLMQMSKFSLYSDDRQRSGLDAISDIYSILRDEAARKNSMDVSYAHALNWISRKVSCFYVFLLQFLFIHLLSTWNDIWLFFTTIQKQSYLSLTHTHMYVCTYVHISWNGIWLFFTTTRKQSYFSHTHVYVCVYI